MSRTNLFGSIGTALIAALFAVFVAGCGNSTTGANGRDVAAALTAIPAGMVLMELPVNLGTFHLSFKEGSGEQIIKGYMDGLTKAGVTGVTAAYVAGSTSEAWVSFPELTRRVIVFVPVNKSLISLSGRTADHGLELYEWDRSMQHARVDYRFG